MVVVVEVVVIMFLLVGPLLRLWLLLRLSLLHCLQTLHASFRTRRLFYRLPLLTRALVCSTVTVHFLRLIVACSRGWCLRLEV